jgi:hypothetical protein
MVFDYHFSGLYSTDEKPKNEFRLSSANAGSKVDDGLIDTMDRPEMSRFLAQHAARSPNPSWKMPKTSYFSPPQWAMPAESPAQIVPNLKEKKCGKLSSKTTTKSPKIHRPSRAKGYLCGRCGQPKRGHVCPYTHRSLNSVGTQIELHHQDNWLGSRVLVAKPRSII